ncbi:MAG: PD-(D/E)XK nuclease family protein, partial [Oscillospiraceae bacterium]|nr:PD-(D/E)XK nuclease family protein [Oscillospiraceae bacterium]
EQCAAILGESAMDGFEFMKLYTTMLSKYDIGTIPVALDRVAAGDFDKNRKRNIRHLIVLGASDERLPKAEEGAGVFSADERQRLLEMDIDLGSGGESELWREFSLIYNTLTMPSETLTLLCPVADSSGAELRPAFVFNRAAAIFGMSPVEAELSRARLSAPAPALGLAAESLRGAGAVESAAREYFNQREPERMQAIEQAANMQRGSLSAEGVRRLYGKQLYLSASRIDKFASCRFAYFCQYGLKAKPHEPAGFKPPEIGTFMHYLLENSARDVQAMGGFKKVDNRQLREITDSYVQRFVHEQLDDYQEKSPRFVYLFKRICSDAYAVVEDMAEELRRSEFVPLDFELDFANAGDMPPVSLGEGEQSLTLTGIADRVDGWLHEGKLYLRVVDYKTGHKEFDLSDIYYGMNLQMLMYLFALSAEGEKRYKKEVKPAGVMYIPARSPILSSEGDMSDEDIMSGRMKELRRSGLIIDDENVQQAWEEGSDKLYIPIKMRYGQQVSDSIADVEKLGILNRHIEKTLKSMAALLRRGSIAADPYY